MEVSPKMMSLGAMLSGLLATVLLLTSLFSAPWIKGPLEDTSTVNRTGSTVTTTNTSGSCSEGMFLKCCDTRVTSQSVSPSSFSASNQSSDSCFLRGESDFHGKQKGAFKTAQSFSALALILVLLAVMLSFLFLVDKLQDRALIPVVHMALLYAAVLCFTIGLIVMGAKYKAFTALLRPKTGWSLSLGIVADVMLLITAIGSTVIFVVRKRSPDHPYGNF